MLAGDVSDQSIFGVEPVSTRSNPVNSQSNELSLSPSLPLPQRCHIAERRQHRCQRAGEQLAHLQAARAPDLCALWRRHQCRSVSSQSGRFLGEARGAMCQVADQGRGKPGSSSGTSSLIPLPPPLLPQPLVLSRARLAKFIEPHNLPEELGGTLQFNYDLWLQQRKVSGHSQLPRMK